eukprot:c21260_g1_i5 orf=475-3924(-)
MNVEKLSRDVWSHHVETNGRVCRICGCEKSRNFEGHESCVCGTSSGMDNSLGMKRPINSFRTGGHAAKKSRLLENGVRKMEANFESQLSNSDKIKTMTPAPDLEPREGNFGKSEIAVHNRRYNDTPAVVPIKKRRIQLMEVMRSPSPPPRSPSPQTPPPSSTPPRIISHWSSPTSGQVPSSVASSPPLLGFSSASSPRSDVPHPMSSAKSQALLPPASHSQPLACVDGVLNAVEGAKDSQFDDGEALETKEQSLSTSSLVGHIDKNFRTENEQQPTAITQECFNNEYDMLTQDVSEDRLEAANDQNLQDAVIEHILSPDKSEGDLLRSESGSLGRDDRLHWDLNTDMAAWDASTDQGTGKVTDDEEAAETPRKSPCGETSQDHRNMTYDDDDDGREQVEEEPEFGGEEPEIQKGVHEEEPEVREDVLEEEPEIGEQGVEDSGIGEHIIMEDREIMEQDTSGNTEHIEFEGTEKDKVTPPSMQVESAWNAPDAAEFAESGQPGPWDADLSSDGRDALELSEAHCHHDDIPERSLSKFGKQAKSSSDDAEGWNYASEEPELEEHVDYGDSDCRDADDMGLDGDDRTSLMQEENNWKGEDGSCHNGSRKLTQWEGDASIASETLVNASSDDGQPLEPSLERQTSAGRSRTSGWDKLPEGFDNAEEALRAAKEVSARRGGRGGSWSSTAGRGSLNSSHLASRFGPGPGPARGTSRDGYSTARGDSYFGDRHPDELMYDRDGFRHGRRADDNYSAHNVVRGRDPGRRPGLFGRGRAGGWMDSQPGHMNQWGPGRHRPSAGFGGPGNAAAVAAARVENSGFIVAPDGTLTKPGGGMGPGRGGIRSTTSGGRGGRGGHIHVGRGPTGEMDGGVHYPLRAGVGADRVGGMNAGGRGMGMGSGPGYAGGMHDRGGRGLIDRYRGGGMESRRSASPRRPHPLDHSNMMGRMAGMRPDSRVVRSRTPPVNHRSVGPTEFTAARNQRSPPPSSRWSNDKREAESYQDRDFKRPLSRSRVPSQRTSPHVVHGSSLTDERDRQVLAGSRHSPPVKGVVNSAHLRKSRDGSLESRPSKRSEEDDVRHTGSFLKDGEYRRSSPTRESDRDREKGSLYRRDRERDDDRRRDSRRSPSRDGRFTSGPKHASTREADDDIAPRRRRPS